MRRTNAHAFTLTELLIALAILGMIATFTIPKILNAQADSRNKAVAKEIIGMVSNAVYLAQTNGALSITSTFADLTPYMNYVAVDTTSTVDSVPGGVGATPCATYKCLRLHNGALLLYDPTQTFSTTMGALPAIIDPDGQVTSKNDSLGIVVDYSSRIADYEVVLGDSSHTPAWFTW